jgi:cytochrome c oxidase assembly protein subunit 20
MTMAGDTRETYPIPVQQHSISAVAPTSNVKSSKTYETFNEPSSANALPDSYGQNTTSSKPENPTLSEAAKTVRIEDFKQFHKYPCTREALLTGIGGGIGIGGVRVVFGGMILLQIPMGGGLTTMQRLFLKLAVGQWARFASPA